MKIKCTFHIAIAFILIQLTDEFSIAFAYGIYVKLYWTNRRNIASGKKIKLDIKRLNVHQKGELDGRRNI